MAGSNSLHISFFFFLIIPCASPLYFNLSHIGSHDVNVNINITGDAYITEAGIQVTPNERDEVPGRKVGRATYIQPLHLWDNASGIMADFTTHFSFVIDSEGNFLYGYGIAFFLAPVGSNIPENATGGTLGLVGWNQTSNTNSTVGQFVAVEFDTYLDTWDPPYTHVGININFVESVSTATWSNDFIQGKENEAWISYNSSSRRLTVVCTCLSTNGNASLDYVVNLRDHLPEWIIFGFSAATGERFETNNIKTWESNSSLQVDTDPRNPTPNPSPNPNTIITRKEKDKKGLVVGLSVGILVIFGLGLLGYSLFKKQEYIVSESSMDDQFEKDSGPKKFSYTELVRATNNFAEEEKLGEGGFGGVYRGFLRELNSYVAVKRVSSGSKQGIKEYASEVKIISRLRHRNLVQLIGWCHERRELLLVYEFMPNGSLDTHLFKEKNLLTWVVRYKIAQGLASALLYLHEEWEQCVVHRDIKSSNVMLDSKFNAKLGDFGLARMVDHGKGSQTTVLAGTMGYIDPLCIITGKSRKESDVYSFGIVVLELACGRKPIDHNAPEDQIMMVEWVWNLYGMGKLLEAADMKLSAYFDEQEMKRLMIVGLWCAHPDPSHRPSIRQAIHVLNIEATLPILPSQMPVPTYSAPSAHMPTSSQLLSYGTIVSENTQIQSSSYIYNTDSLKVTTSSVASSPVDTMGKYKE